MKRILHPIVQSQCGFQNSKLLANRLNKCIDSVIHMDQTGFIPNRFSFFNVRRVMNIMYHKFDKSSKYAIICLDAEKAFDQVEWEYVFKVLERFGLGDSFVSWVRLLYAHPTASILSNENRSRPFSLHRGTRQGCPLSPPFFLHWLSNPLQSVSENLTLLNLFHWAVLITKYLYMLTTSFSLCQNQNSRFLTYFSLLTILVWSQAILLTGRRVNFYLCQGTWTQLSQAPYSSRLFWII